MTPFITRLLRALRCLAVVLPMTTAAAGPLDDMRGLVESGQFEQAYQAAMNNRQLIGNVHFDFLYGVAAINTGHVPEGILALERHLSAVPANDRARLELARGYFLIGEYGRARAEFEFVLRYNPPAGVRANIAQFMQAMELRDAPSGRAASRAYAEVGVGHDSNVNGGTYRDDVTIGLTSVNLAGQASKAVADDFIQVAVGGQQLMRVSNQLSVFAGLDIDQKRNFEAHDYDLTSVGASIGFSAIRGPGLYRGTLSLNELQVGGNRYRDTLSLGGEANYSLSTQTYLVLFGQYAEMRYAGADAVRDARATTLGAMVTQNFPDLPGSPQAGLRMSYTQEDNLRLRKDLDRRVPLVRVFAAVTPAERWRVTAGLTAFTQSYGAEDLVFGSTRKDTWWNFDLVASYALAPRWTLRVEYLNYVNASNQDLYDARRQTIALKTRYQY